MREHPADEGIEEGLGDLEIVASENALRVRRLLRRPHRPVRDAVAELVAQGFDRLADAPVGEIQALDRGPADAHPIPPLEAPPHLAVQLPQAGLMVVQGAADGVGPLGRKDGEVHGGMVSQGADVTD